VVHSKYCYCVFIYTFLKLKKKEEKAQLSIASIEKLKANKGNTMTTLSFGDEDYTKIENATKCFASQSHVIKLGVPKKELEQHQLLNTLIPNAVQGPYEGLVECDDGTQQLRMAFVAAKPIEDDIPMSARFALLLQCLVAGLEALPSFTLQCNETSQLDDHFCWFHDADNNVRLVIFKPLAFFKPTAAMTLNTSLCFVGRSIEFLKQNCILIREGPAARLLVDIRQSFRTDSQAVQVRKLKTLAEALAKQGLELDAENKAFVDENGWKDWEQRAFTALDDA